MSIGGKYINRVQFFDKTLFVDGITGPARQVIIPNLRCLPLQAKGETASFGVLQTSTAVRGLLFETGVKTEGGAGVIAWWKDADNCAYVGLDAEKPELVPAYTCRR